MARGLRRDPDDAWLSINSDQTVRTIHAVAIDPLTPATIYVSLSVEIPGPALRAVLLESTDGGKSWRSVSNGLPENDGVSALAIDPTTTSTIYAVSHGRGVFKSTDGGGSWRAIDDGLPLGGVSDPPLINPKSPSTLYVRTLSEGLFKSHDGGMSWRSIGAGSPELGPSASLVIDPTTPTTLYAATERGVFVAAASSLGPWLKDWYPIPSSCATRYAPTPRASSTAAIHNAAGIGERFVRVHRHRSIRRRS